MVEPDPLWAKPGHRRARLDHPSVRISAEEVEIDGTSPEIVVGTGQATETDTGKRTKVEKTLAAEKTLPTDDGRIVDPTARRTDGRTPEIETKGLNATNVGTTLTKNADGAMTALTLIVVETTCSIRRERTKNPAVGGTVTGRLMSGAAPPPRAAAAVLSAAKDKSAGVRAASTAGAIGKKRNGGSGGTTRGTSGTLTAGGQPGTAETALGVAVAAAESAVGAAEIDGWIMTEMARMNGRKVSQAK